MHCILLGLALVFGSTAPARAAARQLVPGTQMKSDRLLKSLTQLHAKILHAKFKAARPAFEKRLDLVDELLFGANVNQPGFVSFNDLLRPEGPHEGPKIKSIDADARRRLEAYMAQLGPAGVDVPAITKFLQRAQRVAFWKTQKNRDKKAHQLIEALGAAMNDQSRTEDDSVRLLKHELLAAKARALGKKFYREGTFSQLKKGAEISYRDLSESPVTNEAISAAQRKLDAANEHLAMMGALTKVLREVLHEI